MATFPNLSKALLPTDYSSTFNPNSLPTFNYTGSLTPITGGFRGNDPTGGVFDWVPFRPATSSGGHAGNVSGTWGDGGFVADPTQSFNIFSSPDGPDNSAEWGRFTANIPFNDPNTELVRMQNGEWGYRRWNPTGAGLPVQRHDPAHSSFDLIADFVMPVVGSAIVGGAGAGLWGAGAGGAEGLAGAGAAGAFDAGGLGAAEAMGLGAGYTSPAIGSAGLGAAEGLTAPWWEGYGLTAADVGLTASPFTTNPSFGSLMAGLEGTAAMPSFIQQLPNTPTLPPSSGGDSGYSGPSGTALEGTTPVGASTGAEGGAASGGLNGWIQQNLGISGQQAGSLASALLGMFGSQAQAQALQGLTAQQQAQVQQFIGFGAPYRAAANQMLTNPESFFSGPVAQSNLQGVLQGLSVNGNPFGNPTSLALAQQGQRGLYNSTLGLLGQLGGLSGYNQAGASGALNTQLPLLQAQAQGNQWNAIGAGLNGVLNPQPTLQQLLASLGGFGGLGNTEGGSLT